MDGEPIPQMVVLVRHSPKLIKWDKIYEPYICQSNFYGWYKLSIKFSDHLLCALVERWRQETHTFHLSVSEMTITLDDVAILLGLPTHCLPVCSPLT
jgi:Plant mobile domain